MMRPPTSLEFFAVLKWLDGRPLLDTIEPYRRRIFSDARQLRRERAPTLRLRARRTHEEELENQRPHAAALYRFMAWPSPNGNDCFILANDEQQAGDYLSLMKKLIKANSALAREVTILQKEILGKDGSPLQRYANFLKASILKCLSGACSDAYFSSTALGLYYRGARAIGRCKPSPRPPCNLLLDDRQSLLTPFNQRLKKLPSASRSLSSPRSSSSNCSRAMPVDQSFHAPFS
jgi:hypothetical protein